MTLVAVVTAVLLAAMAVLSIGSAERQVQAWNFVLLPLVTIALIAAAARETGEPRAFYGRLALAWSAWTAAGTLQYPLQDWLGLGAAYLVGDVFYGVYYFALLWAIEWAPSLARRSRVEKLISMIGSLSLVAGTIVYLRILPEVTAPDADRVPYLTLYFILDLYIAARFATMARQALGPRMRAIYGLLALGGVGIAVAEAFEIATQTGLLETSSRATALLPWVLATLPVLLAAARADGRPVAASLATRASGASLSILWMPLLGYGLALPAAHIIVYAAGWGVAEAEATRGYFVLAWLAVVIGLIFLERRAIGRRLAETEQALVASREQIRELTRERHRAEEDERRRLSRELHDELGQLLVALRIELAWLSAHAEGSDASVRKRLTSASTLVRSAVRSVRKVAVGLRPRTLDEVGLVAALEELVADVGGRSAPGIELTVGSPPVDLSEESATALYRIARESLDHGLREAGARRLEIRLFDTGRRTSLIVANDGAHPGASDGAINGDLRLLSIRERARAVGATLSLGPGLDGDGYTVRVDLPHALGGEADAATG